MDQYTASPNYTKPNLIGNLQDPGLSMNRRITFREQVTPPIGSNGWYSPLDDTDLDHDNYINLEIVTLSTTDVDTTSETPAIFETEPKDDTKLDLYYQASETYSLNPGITE